MQAKRLGEERFSLESILEEQIIMSLGVLESLLMLIMGFTINQL